jgi:hypothetical protein
MTGRVLLSAIIGGLIVFAWGAFSHMVLPLGETGIKQFTDDTPILEVLKANVKESGFYFFPGMAEETPDMSSTQRKELENKYAEKYRVSPHGILIYHPPDGGEVMSPKQLIVEFVSDAAASLLAALLLAQAAGNLQCYGKRLLFVTAVGAFAAVAVETQYWNWWGFPLDYIGASMVDQVAASFLSGLAIAAIVKSPSQPVASAAPAVG